MAYAPYLREPTVCKNCGAVIGFVKNRNGRWFPVDFVYNPSDPDGECDVQVCFRTPDDVAAAILREVGLARFRFGEYASSPEDCANLYNIPAAALIPNRVFPNAPSLPNAPSKRNPSSR